MPIPRLRAMRIRRKLIFLHTCFSLGLAAILLLTIRPSARDAVRRAEFDKAATLLRVAIEAAQTPGGASTASRLADFHNPPEVVVRTGRSADAVGLNDAAASRLAIRPGEIIHCDEHDDRGTRAAVFIPAVGEEPTYAVVQVRIENVRHALRDQYVALILAVLAVYALIAVALEVFVLPQHVYRPIRRLLEADRALREGRRDGELIPEEHIPSDELGQIMHSRNESVLALRRQERALDEALRGFEEVAAELKRKNHLLETARSKLAHSDRLASLGVMSAGIAHELNTPLAVIKGLAERLHAGPDHALDASQAALMLRVVHRLERLSESLLHFARARPPRTAPADLAQLAEEAATLVRMNVSDRVQIAVHVPPGTVVECDADRIIQVLVNLIRNGCDALASFNNNQADSPPRVEVRAFRARRDDRDWVSITVTDNGPGIDPAVLSRVFEPFVTTRLDARGTGLGLAVADSIVREHDGVILARNRPASIGGGAEFEVMLPLHLHHEPADGPQEPARA
jgi:signal transduction histidine kinase